MTAKRLPEGIIGLAVKGFKSLVEQQIVDICPLTILAGANSSGKSSALQPLLLLKQSLEAEYDPPGPLLLDGPHVQFTSASQILARPASQTAAHEFKVAVKVEGRQALITTFRRDGENFKLVRMVLNAFGRKDLVIEPAMSSEELRETLPLLDSGGDGDLTWRVDQDRCFLRIAGYDEAGTRLADFPLLLVRYVARELRSIIHVPALRGIPARTQPASAVGDSFRGRFDPYVASVIHSWQRSKDPRLDRLSEHLGCLGLTWGVKARPLGATQVEILVGRLVEKSRDIEEDLVSIADVGFGVSQVLPILVALLVAKPGQLVYLEQPEIHLHPRAQEALASVLADAANRGVRVVAETHSSLLLLAIQTLVAKGDLSSRDVKLHWFRRDARGATTVDSADLDELGAYGEWPEDFGSVSSEADHRYLSAVERRAFRPARNAKK